MGLEGLEPPTSSLWAAGALIPSAWGGQGQRGPGRARNPAGLSGNQAGQKKALCYLGSSFEPVMCRGRLPLYLKHKSPGPWAEALEMVGLEGFEPPTSSL